MDTDHPATLDELIRRLRDRTGLHQEQFATRCREIVPTIKGLNQGSISHMENGRITPSIEQFRAMILAGNGTSEELSFGLSVLVGVPVEVRLDDAAGESL